MMIIGEVLVDEAVANERFRCDLRRCKGACCTLEGARGAPLLDEEKERIAEVLPAVRKYLPARSLALIERRGAVEGIPGSYATTCIGDRDCVFVMYDGDVAKCSIEHAFNRGEIPWRKPVSCHLFPLRYSGAKAGLLRYEILPECSAGRERGESDGSTLREFVNDALLRQFGARWVAALDRSCRAVAGAPETGLAGAETAGPGTGRKPLKAGSSAPGGE